MFVQEPDGIKVGDKVRFTGWLSPDVSDAEFGIHPGDVGTITKIFFEGTRHPDYDVDFPTQDRVRFPQDAVLYPGEFELIR